MLITLIEEHVEFIPQGQMINQQEDSPLYALLSAKAKMRVVAGQIVAALPHQYPCSQCPEHLAVPGCEEFCYTRTTSLFT